MQRVHLRGEVNFHEPGLRRSHPPRPGMPLDSAAVNLGAGQRKASGPRAVNAALKFDVGVSRVRKGCGGPLLLAASSNNRNWQEAKGFHEEKVMMTISAFLSSVLAGRAPHVQVADRGDAGM